MAQVYGEPLLPGSDPFTRHRRTGIGGSDAAAVEGVSRWMSRLALWEDKRGLAPPRNEDGIPDIMLWGSRLEHAIRRGYAEDYGLAVTKPREMLRHPDLPYVIGHIDGWTPRDDPKARLLEVKTTMRLDEQWGAPGSADVPLPYFVQVQHYMALTGYVLTDLAVLVGGRQMHIYHVPADQSYIDALLSDEAAFWQMVVDGTPPEPDGSESAGAALRRMYPTATVEEVVATPEMGLAGEDYLAARNIRDAAQGKMDAAAQRIQNFMGARGRMVASGFTATWANRAGSTKWREVAANYRDLLVPHYDDDALDGIAARHAGAPSRTFSLATKVPRGTQEGETR